MSLLVVGSIAIDTIRTPDGAEYKDVLGGSCTYFSVAASHLTDVQVVGVVGDDFEQKHIDLLKQHNVDLQGLEIKQDGATFRWAGTYQKNMNDRTTDDLQFGVLAEFDPQLPADYTSTPFVFLACAQPSLQLKVIDQMQGKPVVVCDTIEFYIETALDDLKQVFARSQGVIVNDSEVKMLTGESNLIIGTEKLLAMGPSFAIVKKGEHGCLLAMDGKIYPYPAYPLRTVKDPTGAGDTFAGGVMGYLAKSGNTDSATLRQAVLYGTALASYTCEGISLDRLAAVTDNDINARVAEFQNMLQVP